MNVTYEHKEELTLIGYYTEIAPNEGYEKCPKFWDEEYAGKYGRLFQTMQPQNAVEKAILDHQIGKYAICAESENGFNYWIAGEYKGGAVPEGLALFTFPESDWAVFKAKGPIPASLQKLNTDVWQEWFPTAGKMLEANGKATLEVYSAGDPQSEDYECEIWVPYQKRADVKICQSCGMPIESEDILGTNADGSLNPDYCKYCYTNGAFTDDVSMEEYIKMCGQFGAQAGMTNEEMTAYCAELFPTLKRWKKD